MKSIFILFPAILMSSILYGQTENEAINNDSAHIRLWTKYPGYVVTKDNDTVKGYLMLKNLIANQDKVFFYHDKDTDKGEAVKYKPKQLKAYKVGPRYYESYKFKPPVASYSTNDAKTYHFVLKVIDGPISLYKWFYEPTERSEERVKIDTSDILNSKIDLTFSETGLESVTFIKKFDGELTSFGLGFKKKMSKIVSDDKELSKKILNKEKGYRSWDLEKIVKEYNNWYLKNK